MATYWGWAIPAVVSMISSKMVAMLFLLLKESNFHQSWEILTMGVMSPMATPGSQVAR